MSLVVGNTAKSNTVLAIVDHIIETYKPHESPCLLMWRETMNSYHSKLSSDHPLWPRDDKLCHEHWKQFGPQVIRELRDRYKLTIVKVSSEIRSLVKHGFPPDRDAKRTDERYRRCLPHSKDMTRGFVAFPRNTQEDHPLIVHSLDRRVKTSVTVFENAVQAVDTANDHGTLSDDSRGEIRSHAVKGSQRALEDKMPLFPRAIECSPGDENPS